MRYRSKPTEIEAVQWTDDNLAEVESFGVKFRYGPEAPSLADPLKIKAGKDGAQDWVPVPVGHWIVRQPGDLTDHWPVDPDYFAAKYEPADDLARLQAIADAATGGEWKHGCLPGINRRDNRVYADARPSGDWQTILDCDDMAFEDALHIATFDPPTVKALLAVVEAAGKFCDDRDQCITYPPCGGCRYCDLTAALELFRDTEGR